MNNKNTRDNGWQAVVKKVRPLGYVFEHTHCRVCGKPMGTDLSSWQVKLQNENKIGGMHIVLKNLQLCDNCIEILGKRFTEQFATVVQDMLPTRSTTGVDDGLWIESVLFNLFAVEEDFSNEPKRIPSVRTVWDTQEAK